MKSYLVKTLWSKLFLIISVILITIFFPAALPFAQANGPILSPDSDLDGLADAVEVAGWRNERANDQGGGAPYRTDPYDTDSDDDGLTDGEEMLFNTNPSDTKDPGLHVVYENHFQTGEYVFAWTPLLRSGVFRPHGHKMIALNTAVIRRGTTFVIGGPGTVNGYPVSLSWSDALRSPGVLSALTISQRNPCGANCNSWSITVPANGTVGKYKLTASNGQGWTDTLILDVIFELPSGLTDAQVDAYLYDGDRNNPRDETGIWFYGSGTDPDQDLKIRLYAQKYDLSQYSSYIFDGEEAVRYYGSPASKYPSAIEAVHGTTTTWDASDKLARRADEFTCFAYPLTPRTSSYSTLFPGGSSLNNQCSNIAGLVTSLHRSVGIPARMVAVDHRNSNFDTSAEIWTRPGSSGSYTWYTTRSFVKNEGSASNNGYCSTTRVAGGYRARVSRAVYGRDYYKPYSKVWPSRGSASNGSEWMMVTANENWSDSETNGWPPEYKWVVWDKYKVARNSWFETLAMPYWNQYYQVNQEPTNVGDPDTTNPPAWNDPIPPEWVPSNPPGTPTLSPIENSDGNGNYVVDWSNVSGATAYRLEEDNNSAFSSPVTRYYGGSSQYTVNNQPSGTWYYRVQTENGAGTGASWSNVRSVTVSSGLQSLTNAPAEPLEDAALLSASAEEAEFEKVRLGAVVGEYGLDDDGDGRFEALVIQVQVEAKQPGSYWLQGQLGTEEPSFVGTGGVMAIDEFEVELQPGQQTVNLVFDGLSISRTRINGPYKLMYLLITDVDDPTPDDFVNASLDYKNNSYVTAAYKFNAFETLDAMFARSYSERSIDQKGDGYAEAVEIDVALDIYRPDAYTVTGELYDGNNIFVGEATWSGTSPKATLRFDQIAGSSGPYELRNLRLSRADGQGLDEIERAYTLAQVSKGEPVSGFTAIAEADSGRLSPLGVGVTASTYQAVGVDTNGNSKYDVLQIRVGTQVVTADSYQLEGWLVDQQGNLVSWAHTGPISLAAGTHTLTLNYDGRALNDYMRTHGLTAQKFTLVALKLYTGPLKWNEINDEVDVAYTTGAYNRDQFEPVARRIVLEDYGEQGTSKWTNVGSPWGIVDNGTYFSQTRAWRAANANASLETVVDLRNTANVTLKFRTYHRLPGGSEVAYVKVSTNGTTWQTIATLTGQLASWQTKVFNLSAFANKPSVRLRFELASAGGSSNDFFYIEDVQVLADDIRQTTTSKVFLPAIFRKR